MARQNGFVFEVTAFLPVETHVAGVAEAVTKMEKATEYFHALGFTGVVVDSKFTSRKAEAPAAPFDREKHAADILNNGFNPMPDLDDSKFATNSGTPTNTPFDKGLKALHDHVMGTPPAGNGSFESEVTLPLETGSVTIPVRVTPIGADASAALDIPPELRRVKKP